MNTMLQALLIILAVFLGFDLILSQLTNVVFPLTTRLVQWLIQTFTGSYACSLFKLHAWVYFSEEHHTKGCPLGRSKVTVYVRQCEACDKRQISLVNPNSKNLFSGWKDSDIQPTDTLQFTKEE